MKKSIKSIKKEALDSLKGKWLDFILIGILGYIIYEVTILIGLLLVIPGIIIASLATYAYVNFSLATLNRKPEFDDLFSFKGKIKKIIGASLLQVLIPILILTPSITMLLVEENALSITFAIISYLLVIYISIRYQFALYIIRDHNLKSIDSLIESYKITNGNVLRILLFHLSFTGWIILAIISFGLLGFWLYPYIYVSNANLYRTLFNEYRLQQKAS